jgi:hypothetical protein
MNPGARAADKRSVFVCPRRRSELFTLLVTLFVVIASVALSSCAGYTTAASSAGGGQTGSPGAGVLSPSASTLNFGNMAVGTSTTQTVSVTNTGTATVNISAASVSGASFTVVGGNPATSVPVGQSASVQVQFSPTALGAATGSLTVTSDASNSTLTIGLSGTGMQPGLTVSPTSLNFSNVTVGQTSSQNVTLTNSGNSNLVVTLATISGTGFTMTGLSLPATIGGGQGLTLAVQFAPVSTTGASGSIVFTDNSPTSPQSLTMTGSAVAAGSTLTANPGSFNFNNVNVGSSSPEAITLTNSGNAPITINQVSTTGSGFSASGISAGQTIAAGATASLTATFAPTGTGAISGDITVTSTATNPSLSIPLSGTGLQAALTPNPASINFGNLLVGNTSTVSVTLSNSGTAALTITAGSISGTGFTLATTLTTPQTLNPGQAASFNVKFAPTTATAASGSVSITSSAPGSPLAIALSGTGTLAQISSNPASVSFGNVAVGGNSSLPVTLTNNGNATLTFSQITVAGAGVSQTGLSTSTTIAAGASLNFNAIFTPTSTTTVNGSITLATNGTPSPLTISLSGTGTQSQPSATPSSISFGSVTEGNSNSQPITLKNNGNAMLTISQITVAGAGMSQTGLSTSTTIAAGASVNFNAIFTPTSTATVSGSITLTTNGTPSPVTINLSGTGAASTLLLGASPTSLTFGNVNDGTSSSLTSTLTNNGSSNITISGVTVIGAGFTASGVPNGAVLTPNQSVTLTLMFAPTNPGAVSGASVSVASNATNSPTVISLSGTGTHSVSLAWMASSTSGVTYNVFRGTATGGESTTPLNSSPVSATGYTDTNVTSGQIYFYVVTAVDSGGSSGDSNEANVTIPTP